jgi:hypothetical protein
MFKGAAALPRPKAPANGRNKPQMNSGVNKHDLFHCEEGAMFAVLRNVLTPELIDLSEVRVPHTLAELRPIVDKLMRTDVESLRHVFMCNPARPHIAMLEGAQAEVMRLLAQHLAETPKRNETEAMARVPLVLDAVLGYRPADSRRQLPVRRILAKRDVRDLFPYAHADQVQMIDTVVAEDPGVKGGKGATYAFLCLAASVLSSAETYETRGGYHLSITPLAAYRDMFDKSVRELLSKPRVNLTEWQQFLGEDDNKRINEMQRYVERVRALHPSSYADVARTFVARVARECSPSLKQLMGRPGFDPASLFGDLRGFVRRQLPPQGLTGGPKGKAGSGTHKVSLTMTNKEAREAGFIEHAGLLQREANMARLMEPSAGLMPVVRSVYAAAGKLPTFEDATQSLFKPGAKAAPWPPA